MTCPVCNGTGELEKPHTTISGEPDVRAMVKTLRDAGYSIRQIMKLIGYKSPQSIQKILTKIKED